VDGPFPTSPESLRILFRELNFRPKKGLGQNFLVRESVASQLLASLGALESASVLEIGGGFGMVTRLLAGKARSLTVFEPDPILFDFLRRHLILPSVKLVRGDVCESRFAEYGASRKLKVIGNLPYASTSAILFHLIDQKEWIEEAVVTLQREVVERCLAQPGRKSYSPLSCAVQYAADVEKLFLIPPGAFYPQPEVTSATLRLSFLPRARVAVADEAFFFRVIRTAFGKRRKQLVNSLAEISSSKGAVAAALKEAGIDPAQRAEELSLEAFARLSQTLRGLIDN